MTDPSKPSDIHTNPGDAQQPARPQGDSAKPPGWTQGAAKMDVSQVAIRALVGAIVGGALGWLMVKYPGAALGAMLGWLLLRRIWVAVAGAAFGLFFMQAEYSGLTAGVAVGVMMACNIDISSTKGRWILLAVIVVVTILGYPALRDNAEGLFKHVVNKK